MRRLENGAPIRDAMTAAEMSIPDLAAKTRTIDPDSKGLSRAYVGFIVGAGKTAREECSDRAAELIAASLGQEVDDLFEEVVCTLPESTSTRRSSSAKPLPEQLLKQHELAEYLRKSPSWIDSQIQKHRRKHGPDSLWPGLFYVGGSRRFDPRAVLAGQKRQHQSA
jgi:hypothetical protein